MAISSLPAAPRAAHAGRYERIRQLGRGGMGTVYLVEDRETGERVALKKLNCVDADSVLRLKREFRALADVRHANLVQLYDLGHDDDGWFLTMEYVNGTDLLAFVCPESAAASAASPAQSGSIGADERLGSVFHQLASGVQALHRAGMLHRDLKPANVLVENGKVRILDFGLVGLLRGDDVKLTEAGAVFGTPEYMAPEQARGTELTEATDWYAVGAMLYEALTGTLACGKGSPFQIIMRKFEAGQILAPRQLDPALPEDLSELCMALLEQDPVKRPRGSEVVARLASPRRERSTPISSAAEDTGVSHTENRATALPFVGREGDLQRLWQAMHRAQDRQTVVIHVRGASGSGKSTLVERFVDDVEARTSVLGRTDTLVLRSRCYEREAMPFKALDGIIDSLVRHLSHLDGVEVGHYLPEDVEALAQVFPALERLKPVRHLLSSRRGVGDAVCDRARAEVAFRELFRRLAARRPLLLWIDDLQWGDLDSARILTSWLGGSAKSSVLTLFSYRSDEVETSACLQHLLQATSGDPAQMLDVGPLSSDDIRELCRRRLSAFGEEKDALIEHVVLESGGSPFLALHLTSLAAVDLARGELDLRTISLEKLIDRTNAILSPAARELLSVLSVAGRPMLPKLALRAIGVRHGSRALVHELRGLNLVRTRDIDGSRLLDVYHDRIREAVCRGLSTARSVRLQEALLSALEFSGRAEPDWLYALSLGAGQLALALRYGITAADRAMAALAFERAAELYAECVKLSNDDPADRAELLRKLATALGCCGHGGGAAEAYLDAAKLAPKEDAVTLMRLAASHLLRTGRFDEGESLHGQVLEARGLAVPKTDAGLMAAIAWERCWVRLHGLDSNLRTDGSAPVELLAQCDIFESVRRDLITIDPLKAAFFAARSLRWAVESGEPTRLVTSLCIAASITAAEGSDKAARRANALLAKANDLAERIDAPAARAVLHVDGAYVAWLFGKLDQVVERSEAAEKLLRLLAGDDVLGAYFLRFIAVTVRISALHDMGRYQRSFSELDAAIEQARSTENHLALLQLAHLETTADVYRGTPEAALPRLDAQRRLLPTRRFGILHTLHMLAVGYATFATGQYAWGMAQFEEDWQRYIRSHVKGMAVVAYLARSTRVRLHLGARAANGMTDDLPSIVLPDLKVLGKIPLPRSAPTHRSLWARVAVLQGNRDLALAELRRSANEYEERGARGSAAITAYAFGLLRGGAEGASACDGSDRFLRSEGIVDPVACVRRYFPEAFSNT
jgi:serine/threonine protein kinase